MSKDSLKNKSDLNDIDPAANTPVIRVATLLPGIDNSRVIPSQPYLIRENSSKVQHKEVNLEKNKR